MAINTRLITFFHAVLFVLGFSLVFIIGWGGTATLIGQVFGYYARNDGWQRYDGAEHVRQFPGGG